MWWRDGARGDVQSDGSEPDGSQQERATAKGNDRNVSIVIYIIIYIYTIMLYNVIYAYIYILMYIYNFNVLYIM